MDCLVLAWFWSCTFACPASLFWLLAMAPQLSFPHLLIIWFMWDKLILPLLQGEHMTKTTVCLTVNHKKALLSHRHSHAPATELVSMPCTGFQSLLYRLCIESLHKQWWPPNYWDLASPVQRYAPDPRQVNEIVWHSARLGKSLSSIRIATPVATLPSRGKMWAMQRKKSARFRKTFLMTLSTVLEPALLLDSYKFQEGRNLA